MNAEQQADMKKPRPMQIYDPDDTHGEVVKGRGAKTNPYNTTLDNGRMLMQVTCKCFGKRTTMGACAGHFAQEHSRLFYAELALRDGMGLVMDLGQRLGAAERILEHLLTTPALNDLDTQRVKLVLEELKKPVLTEAPPPEEP